MHTQDALDHSFWHCVSADLRRYHSITNRNSIDTELRIYNWLAALSPRFAPMLLHRIAYALQTNRLGFLAKFFSLTNFMVFGIEIATRCPIGGGLFFPHTQGTVIGAWRIGKNATIYQGVTLGAKELDFAYSIESRPIIGDDVTIGSGSKVLGGISVGNHVRIGANAVITKALTDHSLALSAALRVHTSAGQL